MLRNPEEIRVSRSDWSTIGGDEFADDAAGDVLSKAAVPSRGRHGYVHGLGCETPFTVSNGVRGARLELASQRALVVQSSSSTSAAQLKTVDGGTSTLSHVGCPCQIGIYGHSSSGGVEAAELVADREMKSESTRGSGLFCMNLPQS